MTHPTPTQEKVWEGWCIFIDEKPLSFHLDTKEATEVMERLLVLHTDKPINVRKVTITSHA